VKPAEKSAKQTSVREKIRHAFAVNNPADALTDDDLRVLDKAAQLIVRRRMEAPVILFLQTLTPISFLGSQALLVLEPVLGAFFKEEDYKQVVRILEHRDGIDRFILKIEHLSKERRHD
jgi:hypothetical protein